MNENLTAAAAREHIRDMRATADRYRAVAEARSGARRRARTTSASRER
jgi:hypothetical protein